MTEAEKHAGMLGAFREGLIEKFERHGIRREQAIETIAENKFWFAAEFQRALDRIKFEGVTRTENRTLH